MRRGTGNQGRKHGGMEEQATERRMAQNEAARSSGLTNCLGTYLTFKEQITELASLLVYTYVRERSFDA